MWAQDAWIGELHSPGYGSVSGDHDDLRTGGHDTEGLIVMRTPGFDLRFDDAPPNARDIGPTVLAILGVEAGGRMEGRSLAGRLPIADGCGRTAPPS
jgi:hypothetical protein